MSGPLALYRALWELGLALRLPEVILRGRPQELTERMGGCPDGGEPAPLWIHAASVGETEAASALVDALRARSPRRIAFSAMTRTGRARAATLAPEVGPFHAPLDAPGPIGRCLDRLRPCGLVLLETELWPNLLLELSGRGLPWAIASGRLSDRGARRLRRVRGLVRRVLRDAAAVGARTREDAERFIELGVNPAVVRVTGDLKEDRAAAEPKPPARELPSWIAACTRPGEEEVVLEALELLRTQLSRGELILAPRHPERFEEVATLVRRAGLPLTRWSERGSAPTGEGWEVLLVDEMGVLAEAYERAQCAFVGGSLRPFGGHSPLEAARAGRAVLMGPSNANCAEAVALLESSGALQCVKTESELAQALLELLGSPRELERRGRVGWEALEKRRGSGERTIEFLQETGVLR